MKPRKQIVAMLLFVALVCGPAGAIGSSSQGPVNTGQDMFMPLKRFDVRQRIRQTTGSTDAFVTTFRFDLPTPLDGGKAGMFYPRIDMPLMASDAVGHDNPNGDTYEFGTGDLLTQFVYVFPQKTSTTLGLDGFALGAQFIWPTAGKSMLGSEKYQVAPLIGGKKKLPQISKGSFFMVACRYFWDYADYNSGGKARDDISELAIQPVLYVNTKEWGWPIDFVNFWATEEIRINFQGTGSKGRGDMFVPFDVMLGKMLNKKTVVSVEFATPIINDYDLYDWITEFRLGFFF
jgi:hypothetical protein